ncbi:GNAT family N-acetyltransferase [Bombilactobacillus thymidiniphilus]|uniref:N-acetyltransferase n=1 Tax=Bombilactobacillus thymidiniphilus TaxID=2923363 RepID=A0ABY4PE00_9LACO|nr:GNAT family N-acetyltransferase [Bombilactobacillus thymidiniphilus]UQS83951.1 N-acetyltransferase [Bombilactobacillus thymidiniphilus]
MDIDLDNGLIVQKNEQDTLIGQLHFTFLPGKKVLSIDQVFVDPQFRNQGWARKILQASIDLAQEKNYKIMPVCPYAKAVFKHEKALQILLATPEVDHNEAK